MHHRRCHARVRRRPTTSRFSVSVPLVWPSKAAIWRVDSKRAVGFPTGFGRPRLPRRTPWRAMSRLRRQMVLQASCSPAVRQRSRCRCPAIQTSPSSLPRMLPARRQLCVSCPLVMHALPSLPCSLSRALSCEHAQWNVRTSGTRDVALVTATVTYAAISANGVQLRAMQNRICWGMRTSGELPEIVHEHTSAPIRFDDMKAILERGTSR